MWQLIIELLSMDDDVLIFLPFPLRIHSSCIVRMSETSLIIFLPEMKDDVSGDVLIFYCYGNGLVSGQTECPT